MVPVVGDLCVVFYTYTTCTESTACTDDNGGTYDFIGSVLFDGSTDHHGVYVRTALFTNTTPTIITVTATSNTSGHLAALLISGMTRVGSNAIRQWAGQANQAAGTTPAPVFSLPVLTANLTAGGIGNGANPPGLTVPTGWTVCNNGGQGTPPCGLQTIVRDSGFTGTTITWGSTSGTAFAALIVELDASAAGPTGYTLNADPGSYTVTGAAAALRDWRGSSSRPPARMPSPAPRPLTVTRRGRRLGRRRELR